MLTRHNHLFVCCVVLCVYERARARAVKLISSQYIIPFNSTSHFLNYILLYIDDCLPWQNSLQFFEAPARRTTKQKRENLIQIGISVYLFVCLFARLAARSLDTQNCIYALNNFFYRNWDRKQREIVWAAVVKDAISCITAQIDREWAIERKISDESVSKSCCWLRHHRDTK